MDFAILFHPWALIFIVMTLLAALGFVSGYYVIPIVRNVFSGYHRIPDLFSTDIEDNNNSVSSFPWIDCIKDCFKRGAFKCALRLTDVKYSITDFLEDTPALLLTSPSGTDLPVSTSWHPLVGHRPRIPEPWLLNIRWKPSQTPWFLVSFTSGLKRMYDSWEAIPDCAKVQSDVICEAATQAPPDNKEDRARKRNSEEKMDSLCGWIAAATPAPDVYVPIPVLPTLVSQWTEPKTTPTPTPFWLADRAAESTVTVIGKKPFVLPADATFLKKADFQRMLTTTRARSVPVRRPAPTTRREPNTSRRFSLPAEALAPTVNWEQREESRMNELRELARAMFALIPPAVGPAPQATTQPLWDYSPKTMPASVPASEESAPLPVPEDSAIFSIGSCDSVDGAAAVLSVTSVPPVTTTEEPVPESEYEYAAVLFPADDSKAPVFSDDDSGFFSVGSLDSLAGADD
ncbi:hypothetical protein GLOTRDRAFT_126066 [Gloeophyllum trabeum ATCC 11539]|uniref:Uncharacterized protein n=1 Tax=Gloeophyllum trabeum (strain ATCC 11539 / FP-39264 / Madison 617) TaxID=670483 RepID=S7S1X1_GLOTA|nr:uncharacterized protein GLOTRDRAFT_126066 [Gloeophyllum trabeum ATCC 11539]EPQ59769.1 hypothetical protein GLOTRDRAFT_126066 [Gloeophyllum trabeum ATCC 11539]